MHTTITQFEVPGADSAALAASLPPGSELLRLPGTNAFLVVAPEEPVYLGTDTLIRSSYTCDLVSDTGRGADSGCATQIVAFDVPADQTAEVDRWYAEEHMMLLMRVPGWLRARRFRVTSQAAGLPYTSIAIHDLRDMEVMDAPERAAARSTPWRAQLAVERWFEDSGRWLYEKLT